MQGTVVVRWERGYEHLWVLVTDLEPKAVQAGWYQMRFWIEGEYKDHKRGQFHWEQTKMTDPKRAERLWLVMAVAMLRAILLGGLLEAQEQAKAPARRHTRPGRLPKAQKRPRGREQSCLLRGQQALLASSLQGEPPALGEVMAPAWPIETFPVRTEDPSWHDKQRRTEQRRRAAKRQQNDRWQHAWPVGATPQEEVRLFGTSVSQQSARLVPKASPGVLENPP